MGLFAYIFSQCAGAGSATTTRRHWIAKQLLELRFLLKKQISCLLLKPEILSYTTRKQFSLRLASDSSGLSIERS